METDMKNIVTLKGCVVEKCIRISSLFSAFRQVFGKDYYFSGETHDFWELVCVVEGAIGVTAGEDVFLLETGQAVLHRPMEFHSFWAQKDTCPDIIVITFAGDIMPAMKEWRFRPGGKAVEELCDLISSLPRIFQIEKRILVEKVHAGREAEAHLFVSRLENILLEACIGEEEDFTRIRSAGAENYRTVVRVLEEHVDSRLTVSEVARLCGISESSIKKTFARYAGIGMMAYFNQMKMRRAAKLMEEGMSVRQAAAAVGFSDQNYFSTVFKRTTGVAPRIYLARREHT